MARYVVVNDNDNMIVNCVEWNGQTQWSPGEGYHVFPDDTQQIGDIYIPTNN